MVYPLSVQGTTIANWGNIFWNYFYLSISCLIVSHIAFFFAKLTETLFIIHTYVHTYIHTYIHTYTHTYIHTYIHTYTLLSIPKEGFSVSIQK